MPNVTIKGSHTVTSYCDTFLDVMRSADQYVSRSTHGLALLHIHRDMPLDVSDVTDRFARLGPHRLPFL